MESTLFFCIFASETNSYTKMRDKKSRLETLKMLISSKELGNQDEVLKELQREGFQLTQATLSRDLKQLKVAKAASMNGKYVSVLPNETMYKRVHSDSTARDMLESPGFLSLDFTGNIGVVRTRRGFASLLAYNIDMVEIPSILGTIAGYNTILLILKEGANREDLIAELSEIIPDIKKTMR